MKSLIVSIHDFHPGSREKIAAQIELLQQWGVTRCSILVIPQYHHGRRTCDDEKSIRYLDAQHAAGSELVLHGHYHDRKGNEGGSYFWTKLYTANEAEFLDLSDGELRHRIELGKKLWEDRQWHLSGFVAPGWLMPASQDKILKKLGFDYTTRLREFHQLSKGWKKKSQSLCYSTRAAWRRDLSCFWNPALFRQLRGQDTVRLSLHPEDFQWEQTRLQIQEIVEMALAEGFQPITYREYAQM
jgi:uncharacterized protein